MRQNSVITRIWHGKTIAGHSDQYLRFLQKSGITDYQETPGILSVKILRRIEGDICHFWTVTEWKDMESIKKFAGEDLEKARYYPEDKEFLLDFEDRVIHCETFTF